jgi:RND family efflux transporter MFP subunit
MKTQNLPGVLLTLCLSMVWSCDRHSDAPASETEFEPLTLTVFTPKVELFMEYPPPVVGEPVKFVSHFTVLATGEPVRSGTLTIDGKDVNGGSVTFRADKPARDGLFTPIHTFKASGKYAARFVLDSPQVTETIDFGEVTVYASREQAAASSSEPQPDPPGAVQFLMEQQWKICMLLDTVGERSLVSRLRCPGEIVAPTDRTAIVSTPIAGRLLAPSGGALPILGSTVQAHQLLAMVEPSTPSLAEFATYALELREKAVDFQRDIDDALAQIRFAKREHERLSGLNQQGVSSEREMYEVERDLALAESQHAAAIAMKAKYDEAAQQLDVFRDAARKPGPELKETDPLRVRLTSPITGQIVSATGVDGEQLDVHEELFRVVNLDRVRVAARVSEFDLSKLPETPNAIVVPLAYPDRRIDVASVGGRLTYFGSVVDPSSRTVAIHFEIPNTDGLLKSGMLADVYLETARVVRALAIPEEAIVMDNGNPVAFVLLEGETLQKRDIEIGIRDSGFVEIKKGLSPGERVVTRGAYAAKLASMSGATFGHGHVH